MNDPEILIVGSAGYQPLYHNAASMTQQQQQRALTTTTTTPRQNLNFQRSNNMYWTLQLKNRQPQPATPQQNLEDLYSTPNKLTKTPRTPASGFSTFFRSSHQTPNSLNSSTTMNNPNDESLTEPPISPINPRNIMDSSDISLLTSTPTGTPQQPSQQPMDNGISRISSPSTKPKLSEELRNKLKLHSGDGGIRSHGNSPSNSGRSTPQHQQQQQARGRHSWANDSVEIPRTCSDRMGTPKTSLMDFKKLLLSKSSGRTGKSASAVEQLLLTKPNASPTAVSSAQHEEALPKPSYNRTANLSALKIQDLSGSPKTFANRRMLRAPLASYGSPGRGAGGKTGAVPVAAAIKAVKHDIMSTSIPEDHSEEENLSKTPPPPAPMQRQSSDELSGSPTSPPSPAPAFEGVNLRDNFFLKTEENNFPRNEILQRIHQQGGYARKQLMQQQRQQFLAGNNNSQLVQNRNLTKVGATLSAIAENQPVSTGSGSGPVTTAANEAGTMPSRPMPQQQPQPSLETSF